MQPNNQIIKIANNKGFNPNTLSTKFTNSYLLGGKNLKINDTCIFLLLCEIQTWLIEKYEMLVLVDFDKNQNGNGIIYTVNWQPIHELHKGSYSDKQYNSYQQALEEGLIKALESLS